jgi:ABC-2 type transport system permease protein
VIGASNFVLLPMTFLSPVFMATAVMPSWIQNVGRFNPVTWSVEAARFALIDVAPDWQGIALRLGLLALFCVAGMSLSVRAFRAYQRSI